jgi:protein-tyrosine-phosphatase
VAEADRLNDVFRVLFVCTGNLCRSPVAERLARAHLNEVLGPGAGCVELSSSGTAAAVGKSMHPFSALVLTGLGGDPKDFVARRLDAQQVEKADLVLTMTREHRRRTLGIAPRALAKTFTLREAADLIRGLGDVVDADAEGPAARARVLVARMATARSHRQSGESDDVSDPIGRSIEIHQEVGEAIAEVLVPLLDRLLLGRAEGSDHPQQPPGDGFPPI